MRRSLTLGLGLFLVAGSTACERGKAKPVTDHPAAEPAPAAAARAELPPAEPAPSAAEPATVYGFVRIANPIGFLNEVRTSILPPAYAMMVNEGMLRSTLAGVLSHDVADRLDLSKAAGCVLASPKRYDEPVVCALAYKGGFAQLVNDLGRDNVRAGGPDFAAVDFDGTEVYLRQMGTHVAVATDPTLIESTRTILTERIVAPKDAAANQSFVMTAFASVIWADAESEITAFTDQIDAATGAGALVGGGSSGSTQALVRIVKDLDTLTLWFGFGEHGPELGYRGFAKPNTSTGKSYGRAAASGPFDPKLFALMPSDAPFSFALNLDVEGMATDPYVAQQIDQMRRIDALSGTTQLATAMTDSLKVWREMIRGPGVGGLVVDKKSASFVWAYELVAGKDSLAAIDGMTSGLGTALGPDIGQYVKVRPRSARERVNGLRVGGMTIEPTKEGRAMLASMTAPLKDFLGSKPQIGIIFAQRGDTLLSAIALDGEGRHLGRLLKALDKPKPLSGPIGATVQRHAADSGLALVNVKTMLDWVRTVSPVGNIPHIGSGPDDVLFHLRSTPDGSREYVLSVSQDLVDQLRAL